MPEPILSVKDLAVTYERRSALRRRTAPQLAVDGVSLDVAKGASVAIVGESGCGKSTLARAVVGLTPYLRGEVTLDGELLVGQRTQKQRRGMQLIFQDPYSSLNPRMTVGQTLAEVLKVHQMREGSAVDNRILELLDLVNLSNSVRATYPRHLSGGQRQRVSIARALATEPGILVADEPVSALDVSVQAAILNLFAELRKELGLTLVMISHNLAVVRHTSDSVVVMYGGRVVEHGRTADVLERPEHDYTKSLLASVPSLVPRTRRTPDAVQLSKGKA